MHNDQHKWEEERENLQEQIADLKAENERLLTMMKLASNRQEIDWMGEFERECHADPS